MWIAPKTNWNNEDYCNAADLNRIEGNTEYIADLVDNNMFILVMDTFKTDWDNKDFPYHTELLRLEDNIKAIKDQTYTPTGFINQTVSVFPSFADFNRWESNLLLLYILINNIINYFQFCGTFTCGEDPTYL